MGADRSKGVTAVGLPGFVPTPPTTQGPGTQRSIGIPRQRTRMHENRYRATTSPAEVATQVVAPQAGSPDPARPREPRVPEWLADYRRHVVALDASVVVVAVLIGQLVRLDQGFGMSLGPLDAGAEWLISGAAIVGWLLLLAAGGAWDHAILGAGAAEYRRVVSASLLFAAVVGIVAYLSSADIFRGYLVISVPVGVAGLLVGRQWWRRGLRRYRRAGSHLRTLLVVGDSSTAGPLCAGVREHPDLGYRVVAVCYPSATERSQSAGDRLGGTEQSLDWSRIPGVALESGVDTVAITATDHLAADRLAELSWRLGSAGVQLTVDRTLLGSGDGRELIPGLPLVAVSGFGLRGRRQFAKNVMDVIIAALGIVVLSPLMLIAAAAVVVADGGPVFATRDWRIAGGGAVRVWSFRCTPRRPKARLADADPSGDGSDAHVGDGPRYQLDTTRVGAVLRRTGVENTPQLFAVLTGRVSMVGPRPLSAGDPIAQPILVKPGLTGPWRIVPKTKDVPPAADRSGEREDFAYIGQWSVVGDLRVVAKTIAGVFAGRDSGV